jgi:hypothetical protein
VLLGSPQWKPIEERKYSFFEGLRSCDLEIEDPIASVSHRPCLEGVWEESRKTHPNLRDIERQRDSPRQATIVLTTEGNVEASLTLDESSNPVT